MTGTFSGKGGEKPLHLGSPGRSSSTYIHRLRGNGDITVGCPTPEAWEEPRIETQWEMSRVQVWEYVIQVVPRSSVCGGFFF